MTEKQRKIMYEKISSHGENLRTIFSFPSNVDMIPVCKKLFSLENKANRLMVDYCNGLTDTDTVDYATEKIYNTVLKILSLSHGSPLARAIIINRDPRGYALKINDDFMRSKSTILYCDWGGYGILAPDFSIN